MLSSASFPYSTLSMAAALRYRWEASVLFTLAESNDVARNASAWSALIFSSFASSMSVFVLLRMSILARSVMVNPRLNNASESFGLSSSARRKAASAFLYSCRSL